MTAKASVQKIRKSPSKTLDKATKGRAKGVAKSKRAKAALEATRAMREVAAKAAKPMVKRPRPAPEGRLGRAASPVRVLLDHKGIRGDQGE